MKTLINILCLFLLAGCNSCELNDITKQPKTELEKLPPATQEGKYTFGCLVNGKAWYTYSGAYSDYQLGSLSIGATVIDLDQSIGINLREKMGDPVLNTGTYSLLSSSSYSPTVSFLVTNFCFYGTTTNPQDLLNGSLSITKFDKSNYIISGTFNFTFAHMGCDTLKVTDGRFDIEYAP